VCELLGNEVGLTSVCRVENNFLLVVYDKARDDDSQKSVAQAIPTTYVRAGFNFNFSIHCFFPSSYNFLPPSYKKIVTFLSSRFNGQRNKSANTTHQGK
jgi:hypothetical protein